MSRSQFPGGSDRNLFTGRPQGRPVEKHRRRTLELALIVTLLLMHSRLGQRRQAAVRQTDMPNR